MFGQSPDRQPNPSDPLAARERAFEEAQGEPSPFGFEQTVNRTPAGAALADFDQLGQTLVATITVVNLTGPDAGQLAAALYTRIYGSTESPDSTVTGVRHVVLDLQNVEYMDSMCIGVMVELLTKLKNAGGRIALVNASSNVEYLFRLTRLDRVFPICRDVMKAIESVEREG